MAKKRKCRYTPEELEIHNEAVKLRKMTDAQLVEAFKSANSPQKAVLDAEPNKDAGKVEKLLKGLFRGDCKGVKSATAYKVQQYAVEIGVL